MSNMIIQKIVLFIYFSIFTSQLVRLDAAVNYVNHGCVTDYGNYTKGSSYQKNLNLLMSRLSSQASHVKFINSTAGDGSNKVYAIFQCREDLSLDVCTECMADASKMLVQKCPLFGEAIVWYDECMLRYANRSIFSLNEMHPSAQQWSLSNFSNYVEFAPVLTKTMNSLIGEVVQLAEHFSTKEANVTMYDKLYCLAQCTPDLNGHGCNICLKAALVDLNNCCKGSIRAVVFFPSCQIKYDMVRFYNQTRQSIIAPTSSTTLRHQEKKLKSSMIVGIAIATSVGIGLLLAGIWLCLQQKKAAKTDVLYTVKNAHGDGSSLENVEFLKYEFATLKAATKDFSIDNKLGEGGFGVVFKGTLRSGEEVAIKRLFSNARQGEKEFLTEAGILAKLQHRNLVKLQGFCSDKGEKLLVYEFMPNTSLDRYLFSQNQSLLQWDIRYKIIMGITRGLHYLHVDSRLTVVHRDLKASNILLDSEMNPKIADFGLAKLISGDEKFGNTSQIAGTLGYMAPEYVLTGEYSEKSDVYSFGIIVLEIVSGQKNRIICQSPQYEDLPIYAWRLWSEGRSLKLVDPTLYDNFSRDEALRCIQIGILCVQENAVHRPTIAEVALMLTGSIDIPTPSAPAMFSQDTGIQMDVNSNYNLQRKDALVRSANSFNSNTDVDQDLYRR